MVEVDGDNRGCLAESAKRRFRKTKYERFHGDFPTLMPSEFRAKFVVNGKNDAAAFGRIRLIPMVPQNIENLHSPNYFRKVFVSPPCKKKAH